MQLAIAISMGRSARKIYEKYEATTNCMHYDTLNLLVGLQIEAINMHLSTSGIVDDVRLKIL